MYVSAPVFDGLPPGSVVSSNPEDLVKAAKRDALMSQMELQRAMTISPF